MLPLWALFDPSDIDRTWARLEGALLTLTVNGRQQSGAVAGAYYRGFRMLEGDRKSVV